MAVDLKIELFSVDLFRHLWYKSHLTDFIPPRIKINTEKSENSPETVHAVWIRQQLFQQNFYKKIKHDFLTFSSTGADFYLYIHNNVLQFLPYQLNVFDKLFMTCAFVLEMCSCCSFHSEQGYLYFAPLSWAMFFDSELKSEFYFEGGWEVLHRYANSYSTHIFTRNWMRNNAVVDSDDYENVKILFESADKLYNISRLVKKFTKRYKKRQDKTKVACLKCLPMFSVFKSIAFPDEQKVEQIILVEGYLQIILRTLTTDEIDVRREQFIASLRGEDGSESEDSSERDSDSEESTNSSSEESSKLEGILVDQESSSTKDDPVENEDDTPGQILNRAFKLITTAELLQRIFIDEASSKVECDCGLELCIFCGRTIDPAPFPNREEFSVHVERIKSTIAKVVDKEAEIKPATQAKRSDDKDVMRMFPSLGLKPMKKQMLTILETEQKEKAKNDVEDASEILSSLNLTDSPTKGAKSKRKKKKSVKK